MYASTLPGARLARPSIVLILVLATVVGWAAQPAARAADPSPGPVASGSPAATEVPKTACESAADLRLYIGFLQDQSLSDDGLAPILVGVFASLTEARRLTGLVNETYRPLVDSLTASLQDLQASVRGFRDQGTIGAGLVQLGEAITGIGITMDALDVALREPCPIEEPGASGPPAASASPPA